MSTITFNANHLDLMLAHSQAVKKYYLLSATKQKIANELVQAGMMKIDEEQFVHLSELGYRILDFTITQFNIDIQAYRSPE